MTVTKRSASPVPLVRAPQGSAPAFAQVQAQKLSAPSAKRVRHEDDFWGPPEKHPRRKPGEICPYSQGKDLLLDIVTLCWWANRGRSDIRQRAIRVPESEKRVDVYEAVHLYKDQLRAAGYVPADVWGADCPKSEVAQARVLAHQPQQTAFQQPDYFQVQDLGLQYPILQIPSRHNLSFEVQQYPTAVPQVTFGPYMPDSFAVDQFTMNNFDPYQQINTAPQQLDTLQANLSGFQMPIYQQPQVFTPATQFQQSEPQPAEFLPAQVSEIYNDLDLYDFRDPTSLSRKDSGYSTFGNTTPEWLKNLPTAVNGDAAVPPVDTAQFQAIDTAVVEPAQTQVVEGLPAVDWGQDQNVGSNVFDNLPPLSEEDWAEFFNFI